MNRDESRHGDSLIARADEDRIRMVMPDASPDPGERIAHGSGEDRAMRDGWWEERRHLDGMAGAEPAGPGDTATRDAVAQRLAYDVCVDEGDIILTVGDGVVVLEGLVNDELARRRAGDIAAAVQGVRQVRNGLSVRNISAAVATPAPMNVMNRDLDEG